MRTSLFITLIASIIILTAALSFSQQSEELPKRAKKPPDVSPRKKHHSKPQQYFIYDQEYQEYQESPTIIINIQQGANEEAAKPREIPEGPQSSGAMIIEKRGDVYERIDHNPPVPSETPPAADRNTPPNPGTGACLNCKVR